MVIVGKVEELMHLSAFVLGGGYQGCVERVMAF